MPMTKQQILAEVMSLDPRERGELVEDLRQAVGGSELSSEQLAELRRRVSAIDRGEATLLDGDQVMRELRDRLASPR